MLNDEPTNLKSLDLAELQAFVASLGEESYRAQQIFKWMYGSVVNDFEQMTNLSKAPAGTFFLLLPEDFFILHEVHDSMK
jgi:adenine C2-methylase RlmN of 23S rRNA A2503 and tRNA A37